MPWNQHDVAFNLGEIPSIQLLGMWQSTALNIDANSLKKEGKIIDRWNFDIVNLEGWTLCLAFAYDVCSLQNVSKQFYGKFADFLVFQFKNCLFMKWKFSQKPDIKFNLSSLLCQNYNDLLLFLLFFLRFSIDFENVLSHIPTIVASLKLTKKFKYLK